MPYEASAELRQEWGAVFSSSMVMQRNAYFPPYGGNKASQGSLEPERNSTTFYVGEASPFETNQIRSVLAWILRGADAGE